MIIPKILRWLILIAVILLQGCTINMSLTRPPSPLREHVIEGEGRPKILLLDISGFISERERGGSVLRIAKEPSLVVYVREVLQKAEKDKRIAGIIVKINSPGGTVAASDIIYHELVKFKQMKKIPVYACITGIGTSGGYYVATAAEEITVHPSAITGSIGVIALKFNIEALLSKIGVEEESIKSGEKKDIFSPFRPSTPEEREIMQTIINHLHGRFVDAIFAQRKGLLTKEQIEKLGDGRLYTAEQAMESKLIDHIGYLDDTVERMKKFLGLEQARIISYYRSGDYPATIYSAYPADHSSIMDLLGGKLNSFSPLSGVEFMYLWKP
jgi:protease-4